ncbi:MAG: hypothetical protein KJO98_14590 [Rhodothermia bacterium]|nr:hypothetical protein [Rhodothermia bacterium]
MSDFAMAGIKELRYYVMLALYFPILLYAFSTFDLSEETFVVNSFEPIVVGSDQVVLGQPFEGRAFLAVGGGEGQRLEGAGELETLGDSVFTMRTGDILKPNESEKTVSYEGAFHFTQVGGEVARIPVEGTFRVRRPDIVAFSEATQTVYRLCSNSIRIEVPGLENRPLSLSAGGQSIRGRQITLSPSGKSAEVKVSVVEDDREVFLGSKSFAVIDPPRPEIRVTSAGRPINNGESLSRRRALLEFAIEADESFKRRFPKDARYVAGSATVYLRKGMTASKKIGSFRIEGNKLVLTKALRDARPGDRVLIRLEGIKRINHAGQAVSVQLHEASRTFGYSIS